VGALEDSGHVATSEQFLSRTVDASVEGIARELANPPAPNRNTLFSTSPTAAAPPAPPPAAPAALEAPPAALAPLQLEPGALVAERYKLVGKLGEGGTAIVFRATDLELNEDIVLKIFNQLLDDQALARFRQELALSRQLVHPNIVRLFDLGSFRGQRYITMELLVGTDLKGKLGKGLRPKQALDILIQSCAGLKAAHDRGIVHRDVKPDNIFVTESGVVKVMDFGIAKGQAAKGVTVAGMIAGTPEYMAPEQINNFTTVTGATDQYALGVTAYEMFTGKLPFTHADLVPLLMMHVNEAPPPPRSINPKIPAALEAIVLKCLAKNPADRFADCGALGQALTALHSKL
jgi:eukaryotic-like serine/threonine-protein kinase